MNLNLYSFLDNCGLKEQFSIYIIQILPYIKKIIVNILTKPITNQGFGPKGFSNGYITSPEDE
jgi:hypothetical protein